MNRLLAFAVACFVLAPWTTPARAQSPVPVPTLMNFQGRLARPDGTPVPDGNHTVVFTLYDALTGGTVKWTETRTVLSRNGVFAVLLGSTMPLNETVFAADRWLEVSVDGATLTPRQRIVSQAFAFKANLANTVPDASITGAKIAAGTITGDKFAANLFNPLAWLLGGNSGTNGTQFLGTTDPQPLVFKVNGRQAMRYQYTQNTSNSNTDLQYRSINVLGGSEINSIADGVVGATIAGGGLDYFTGTDYPNRVSSDFSTVGGGLGNTASGRYSTVAGGYKNTVAGVAATIAGGINNATDGYAALVAGGSNNMAGGPYASVAGGESNIANGQYSLAAGSHARAIHDGTFVWKSYDGTDFYSTAPGQFLISAYGGVGINTSTPGFPLSFPDTLGDKISLWGQSGDHFGLGIATGTLQIYSRDAGTNIDMGYGRSTNFTLAARSSGNGDFLTVRDSYARHFYQTSDARYKTDVQPVGNALETVMGLRGVLYSWDKAKWPTHNFMEGRQIGFLAQEVESVLPELVVTDKDGYKSVNYVGVVPVLVEAMKQQQKQIGSQQQQIAALQANKAAQHQQRQAQQQEIAELKRQNARISDLEAKLNALLSARK